MADDMTPEKRDALKKAQQKLEVHLSQMKEEQKQGFAFQDELFRVVKAAIYKNYPELKKLSSEGYRKLEEQLSKHIVYMVQDVSEIMYDHLED